MRPFIYGGQAVWYEPIEEIGLENIKIGDIIVVKIKSDQIVHRLIAIEKAAEFYITKGDPLLVAEAATSGDILGRVVEVLWDNDVPISMQNGFTGFLNRVYGRLAIFFISLERRRKGAFDRANYRFRGKAYKISFLFLLPIFYCLIWAYTNLSRLLGNSQVEGIEESWDFAVDMLRGSMGVERCPTQKQIQLILNHSVAGVLDWSYESLPQWAPIFQEKKRQLLKSVRNEDQFFELVRACEENEITMVPLKGMSLRFTIYGDEPAVRAFGDIDLFVPFDSISPFVGLAKELGYIMKNPGALDKDRLREKNKVELYHPNRAYVGLDIHASIFVKKLSNRYGEIFLRDAVSRLRNLEVNGYTLTILDPIDEWLFLAQHYILHHRLSGMKWLYDLYLHQKQFHDDSWAELANRSRDYGLRKITFSTQRAIQSVWGDGCGRHFRNLKPGNSVSLNIWMKESLRPRNMLKRSFARTHQNIKSAVENSFWEVVFVDRKTDQLRALRRIFFPGYGLMKAFYGSFSKIVYISILPFHVALIASSFAFFIADTLLRGLLILARGGNG